MNSILKHQTFWFIIQRNEFLLLNNTLPNELDIASLSTHFIRRFRLGAFQGSEYRCAELPQDLKINEEFNVVPVRQALSLFSTEQFGIGVKAYSVINWDKNHQFCGRCGTPTVHPGKNFERICPACKISFFPRISPSIIVLIHKKDQLVMARSPHFLPGVYGLIAGFVEIGESLEEAVHREVEEEVGLQIKNLNYFGSQPWPFPDSLMVAFTAEYAAGEIKIDQDEIEEAGWYNYDNLPGRPSTAVSIASRLLDSFINECKQKYG
jgi:NAD+ diphosphatase